MVGLKNVSTFFFQIGRQSKTKLEVELPLVNHRQCKNKFKELGITLNADQLCAGGVYGMLNNVFWSGVFFLKKTSDEILQFLSGDFPSETIGQTQDLLI